MNALTNSAEHRRIATLFERWIGTCMRAGEAEQAERCRMDAELHWRTAERMERTEQ